MQPQIRTTQVNIGPEMIDIGIGQPDASLLPLEIMKIAADHRLSLGNSDLLGYGPEPGDGYFLLALADFLSSEYGYPVAAESLFTTGGSSHALDLICTLFTQPGDIIFAEEPTYFLALRIFEDHGVRVIGLPMDAEGLRMETLEEKLQQIQPKIVYTIPTFHNPTGGTLSAKRRKRLVELSQEHGFLIMADEVYPLLHYTQKPPAPMAQLIDSGSVLSFGSFSKILAPGLRLGWIQAAPHLLKRLTGCGFIDSGGSPNHFTANLVRSVLELGLQQEHLAMLRATYKRRSATLCNALREHLPHVATFVEPAGGFFVWIELPESFDTALLLHEAAKINAGFQPGIRSSSNGGLRNCLRLSFAYYDEDKLAEGVRRIAQVIR